MTGGRTTNAWISSRAPAWQALAQTVAKLRRQPNASMAEATAVVDSYRDLARDLAGARRLAPGTRVALGLEALYLQLHSVIHHSPRGGWRAAIALLRDEVPAVTRELAPRIFWIVCLMAASAGAGWWLIATYPSLISLIASEEMIEHVENGSLWTDGIINVTPSSVLSVRILSNNIVVSLFAVCAGLLFGLGTFYLIALNGLMLGALFAFVHQHGLALQLFKFIIAHGLVELSVICIAGAIGAAVGDSLIRPTHATRRESFQFCVMRVAPLMGVCAILLVGSGFIEGFVSPDPTFPLLSRVTIGISYWILMVLVLGGWAFRPHASGTPASGTPASRTPASGTPASGTPASRTPASLHSP
jgi:uncharacterized membrane protein SpoIIM required for sporulation